MHQLITTWAGLSGQRKIVLILATMTILTSFVTMTKMATSPSMVLLYADLESSAAGRVIGSLEQERISYEVRGRSIYVEAQFRDELRMTLASEGLPSNGSVGYELLDSLNGFGTTSQMFDAAYWRAKEGELARTIVASSYVDQARVHIAQTGADPFLPNVERSASVSITPSGAPITTKQAKALRHLIASAVAGLSVTNVSIIDDNGVLIGLSENSINGNSEQEKTQIVRDKVLRLVEARVGLGNAVVEVSMEIATETETIRKRIFDPESRAVISVDTEERIDNSKNGNSNVTVASNLPDGNDTGADGSVTQISETRERTNFEVSETEHEILKTPGAVKRLTVAILVNGLISGTLDNPELFQPRSENEITALRELVESVVGFDAERGDVITLKSMDLPKRIPAGTHGSETLMSSLNLDIMSLIQITFLTFVALTLGLFVIRPIMSKQNLPSTLENKSKPTNTPDAGNLLNGEIDNAAPQIRDHNLVTKTPNSRDLSELGGSDNPVERLRSMIGERQDETVEILRGWLEERESST